ncbi:hypothetical protein ACHAWF_011271 [Thalassiosira exigua]
MDFIRASFAINAAAKAGTLVYELTLETARLIFGFLVGFTFGKGLSASTSMSRLIRVVKTGVQVVIQSDFAAVVVFVASISINLAVVNSLPLPALDGGQILFVLTKAAAGRCIDQRLQESINTGVLEEWEVHERRVAELESEIEKVRGESEAQPEAADLRDRDAEEATRLLMELEESPAEFDEELVLPEARAAEAVGRITLLTKEVEAGLP